MARRRFVRRLPKRRVSWVTTLFNETAFATDASTPGVQVLLNNTDFNAAIASTRKMGRVLRVIFKGTVNAIGAITADATDSINGIWACGVSDNEDTDLNNINTTAAGSWLSSNRIIQVGHFGGVGYESNTVLTTGVAPGWPVDIDVRTRINLGPDENLVVAAQWQGSVTATITASNFSGISRVLIEEP